MKRSVKDILIKSVAILLIGFMGMMITDKAVFLHTHKLSDGTIIVHAHPYNKSTDSKPFKTHHHTNTEYLFFHSLEVLFPILFLAFVLFLLYNKTKHLFFLTTKFSCSCIFYNKGRAPPIS